MTAPQESARAAIQDALEVLYGIPFSISEAETDRAHRLAAERLRAALAALDGEAREREKMHDVMHRASDRWDWLDDLLLLGAQVEFSALVPSSDSPVYWVTVLTPDGEKHEYDGHWLNEAIDNARPSLAPLPSVTSEATPLLDAFAAQGRAALAGGLNPDARMDEPYTGETR